MQILLLGFPTGEIRLHPVPQRIQDDLEMLTGQSIIFLTKIYNQRTQSSQLEKTSKSGSPT